MSLPPGPRLPGFMQTLQWLFRPTEFMTACAARYGEIFTIRLTSMGGPVVMTSNPEAIRQLFALGCQEVTQPKSKEFLTLLGRSSLFLTEGEEHMRVRRLILPALGPERALGNAATIHALAEDAIDSWPLGVPFKLQEAMQSLALRTTFETLLGSRCPERVQTISRLHVAASALFATPLMLIPIELQRWVGRGPWVRLVQMADQVGQIFRDEVRHRRATGAAAGPDVLSMLLQSRDPEGHAMTEGEIRDALIALIVAGHDSSVNATTWALYRLIEAPALCQRLRRELDAAVDGGTLRFDRLATLPLLDATVREVLRLHPIFPVAYCRLSQPMRLMGHDLPAGTRVGSCIYLAQRRASAFPEPDRFLPDRFLEKRPTAFEWLPFGGGFRRCVGAALVTTQMKVVLATVLQRAILQSVPGPPVRIGRAFLSLAPSGGVPAVLVSRNPRGERVEKLRAQA